MGKLKIHELAKQLEVGSKEVIAKAQALGIEVTSHLSAIDEEIAQKIRDNFKTGVQKEENIKKDTEKQEKQTKKEKKERANKKETTTPVIIRREVILADEEQEEKKEQKHERKDVGFVERKKNQDYNIVYRKQPLF